MLGKIFMFLFITGALLSVQSVVSAKTKPEKATFAGGCFWCMEHPFEEIDGVLNVISGYTGGNKKDPTYKEVSAGVTGHVEAVQITYDPARVTYPRLLDVFWMQVDPTDQGGQFVDRGAQYTTAIFYNNEEQRRLAEESKTNLQNSGRFYRPIITPILKASKFYPAEEYHQDYYKKKPIRYKIYRAGSGRDRFLRKIWDEERKPVKRMGSGKYKKPSDEALRTKLTPLQYHVTQEEGTEKPFDNEYWNNKKDGIYVDIASGEPLFVSLDKFDSGTGWPSFTKPLEPENIVERKDRSFFMIRTEIRSRHGGSHLGHLFDDGPPPTGLRYCINSAALRFIPKENLKRDGYGGYTSLFD